MKVKINTIGKKIHTLVKETHRAVIKSGRIWKMISLKRPHFSVYHCVFFPAVAQILVSRSGSCFLTHIKKYMTPIHALIFEKHVKMCVYIRQIKKPV